MVHATANSWWQEGILLFQGEEDVNITSCGLPSEPTTESGKIWAIVYAFYGAAYFAGVFVTFVTPIGHRMIQRYIYIAHRKATEKLQQAQRSPDSLGSETKKRPPTPRGGMARKNESE